MTKTEIFALIVATIVVFGTIVAGLLFYFN